MEHASQIVPHVIRKVQPKAVQAGIPNTNDDSHSNSKGTYDVRVYLNKESGTITHRVNGKFATIEMPTAIYRQMLSLPQEESVTYAEQPTIYGAVDGFQHTPKASLNGNGTRIIHTVGALEFAKHVNYYKAILGVPYEKSPLSGAKQSR